MPSGFEGLVFAIAFCMFFREERLLNVQLSNFFDYVLYVCQDFRSPRPLFLMFFSSFLLTAHAGLINLILK